MKKPASVVYGVDDTLPFHLLIPAALQHCAMLVFSMFPVLLICQAANASNQLTVQTLNMGLLAAAVGTVLQARSIGPFGSGYLLPNGQQSAFLGPSLVAAQLGGLPLVFGMTIVAGVAQTVISRFWKMLRPFVPTEVAGLVVVLIGMQIGSVGLEVLLAPADGPPTSLDWWIAGFTLFTAIALLIWAKGFVNLFSALIGVVAGYALSMWLGVGLDAAAAAVKNTPVFAMPSFGGVSWSFDSGLLVSFIVVGVACAMGTSGNIVVAQRLNDAEWVRPDLKSVSRGTLTDGLTESLAGLAGACGVGTLAPSVGVMAATGITSRKVAYAFGIILFCLAFFPMFSALITATPRPVLAAALLFSSAFVMVTGLQIVTSRLLDARKTIVIAMSMWATLAVFMYPALGQHLPQALRPLVASGLVAGTTVGFLLNAIFRLGISKRVLLIVAPRTDFVESIRTFLLTHGAAWGARSDVIQRAQFGVTQTAEVIFEECHPSGPVNVAVRFDEFNLDIDVSYQGDPLEFSETRPSTEDIFMKDGARRLAGFLIHRYADRVAVLPAGEQTTVRLHFDH